MANILKRFKLPRGYFMAHPVEGSFIQRESKDLILYGPDNKPITYMLRNIKKARAFATAMTRPDGGDSLREALTELLECFGRYDESRPSLLTARVRNAVRKGRAALAAKDGG